MAPAQQTMDGEVRKMSGGAQLRVCQARKLAETDEDVVLIDGGATIASNKLRMRTGRGISLSSWLRAASNLGHGRCWRATVRHAPAGDVDGQVAATGEAEREVDGRPGEGAVRLGGVWGRLSEGVLGATGNRLAMT